MTAPEPIAAADAPTLLKVGGGEGVGTGGKGFLAYQTALPGVDLGSEKELVEPLCIIEYGELGAESSGDAAGNMGTPMTGLVGIMRLFTRAYGEMGDAVGNVGIPSPKMTGLVGSTRAALGSGLLKSPSAFMVSRVVKSMIFGVGGNMRSG
jgi:hypothetical protein